MTGKKIALGEHPGAQTREWISAFNTAVLTTLNHDLPVGSLELSTLMQSPEFASLVIAAQHLAESTGLTKEEASERLIVAFRKLDRSWTQLIMKRGLQSMLD